MKGRSNADGAQEMVLNLAQRKRPQIQVLEFIGIALEEGLKLFTAIKVGLFN
jgi:hypothetical protein